MGDGSLSGVKDNFWKDYSMGFALPDCHGENLPIYFENLS